MSKFIPEVTEATIEKVISTEKTITNLPPIGTRIRATLGESVLVGTIRSDYTQGGILFQMTLDGPGPYYMSDVTVWLAQPWEFEVLDEPQDEPLDGFDAIVSGIDSEAVSA